MIYMCLILIDKSGKNVHNLHLNKIFDRSEPETFGQTPACRNNHTTAVYGDKIYFHGGHDGN